MTRTPTKLKMPKVVLIAMAILAASLLCGLGGAEALSAGPSTSTATATQITDVPPLIDVPVWSMATLNDDDGGDDNGEKTRSTNVNLLTYASPVAIRPSRLYALGLYKETKSRDNFLREKTCVLQLLSASNEKHTEIVRLLGGTSGKDVSKEETLASEHGIPLQELAVSDDDEQVELPKVLPGCVRYLQLTMVGDDKDGVTDYDGGESCHDVVICRVDRMWTSSPENDQHLSTGRLRELGLITEQGRIAPLPDE